MTYENHKKSKVNSDLRLRRELEVKNLNNGGDKEDKIKILQTMMQGTTVQNTIAEERIMKQKNQVELEIEEKLEKFK